MNWCRRLMRRARIERQLDDELRFHLEQHASDLIERGTPPAEAWRAARLAIGGPEQVKEACRDARGTRWLEDLLQDARYALRGLRQNLGFAAVTTLTLALGIGATTAIFTAVNPVLFEALPYPNPSRIVTISYAGEGGVRLPQAFGTYRELVSRSRAFDPFAVYKPWQPTLTGGAEPERLDGQRVTAEYFRVLGIAPALGRDFAAGDDVVNGPNVIILADGLWRRRFQADHAIVGRQVVLNDTLFTVIGVMPSGFENVLAASTEIWAPLQYDSSLPADGREWGHHLNMVARLRAGFALDQGKRELDQIAHAPVPEFPRPPWAAMKQGLFVNALRTDLTRAVKPALLAILGAVILLLAIACVNVTNLLLARGAQRRGEFAMRAALGAGRARIIRQLLSESLLLTLLGGTFGVVFSEAGIRALLALSPPDLPRAAAIHVDIAVLAFAVGITLLIGLAVGLVPALHVTRGDLQAGLQQGSRRSTGTHQLTRRTLVVSEVALALVLLVAAGLLRRSIEHLFNVAPGFNPSNVLTMEVQVASPRRFPDNDSLHRFYSQALDAVRRVPGVTAAAFTSQLPLSVNFAATEIYGVRFENDTNLTDSHEAYRSAITPDYFDVMRIPLVRGRLFDTRDTLPARVRPVIINQSFARRKFPGSDPIGQRLRFGGPTDRPWDVIVGVVGDVKLMSLAADQTDSVYVASAQWLWPDYRMWLVVRSQGDVATLAPAIKKAVWSVDKDQPVVHVATMDRLVASSAAQRRFALIVFEVFALAALALAAIGIFGILSGGVAERMREIGVRSALGASRGDILALIIGGGIRLTAVGVAIGLAAAIVATRALTTLLFGVSRLDPITYIAVTALLAAVSGLACWIPAWRAARVDPCIALRAD